jgi:hypothetical protein
LQLRESLVARTKSKPGGNVTEALHCVGVLAGALHLSWTPYAQQLLDCMMLTGPSQVRCNDDLSYVIYMCHKWLQVSVVHELLDCIMLTGVSQVGHRDIMLSFVLCMCHRCLPLSVVL